MGIYQYPTDIANAALQKIGLPRIETFNDNSKAASEVGFCYDPLRVAELRRTLYRFAIKRAVLRALTLTTLRIIAFQWEPGNTYPIGSIVQDLSGVLWVCMIANGSVLYYPPGSVELGKPSLWEQYFGPLYGDLYSDTISYYAGELTYYVEGTSRFWAISLTNNNLNNPPASSPTDWTILTAADLPVNFLVAAGPGVTLNTAVRNIFPLPNGYLRMAPQDPRSSSAASNITSAGLRVLDYEFESSFICSAIPGPIVFRFCSDFADVAGMDQLFCEGLAYRIALEICETLTQSQAKYQQIAAAYTRFIAEARAVNYLELGSTEPEEEEYMARYGPAGVIDNSVAPAPQQGGTR